MTSQVETHRGEIDRRRFGVGLAGLVGANALGLGARESHATPRRLSNAPTYQFTIGDIRATAISDGQITFPAWPTYAPDVAEPVVHDAMRRNGLVPPDYRLDANALLIETGDRRLLIDAGWGAFDPAVGGLPAALRSIGADPLDIDMVVLSHIHLDHVGGLAAPDGAPVFARADIVVAEEELAQWRQGPDFGAMTVDEGFKPVFAAAAETVFDQGARLRSVNHGEEIAPGVSLFAAPGHTRGHSGVRIASGDEELLYVADCFHDQAFDLAHPDWRTVFDYDPTRAAETRRALLDRAAVDGALLMAFHMPFPGLGRVAASDVGYFWTPARWRLDPASGGAR